MSASVHGAVCPGGKIIKGRLITYLYPRTMSNNELCAFLGAFGYAITELGLRIRSISDQRDAERWVLYMVRTERTRGKAAKRPTWLSSYLRTQ